MQQDHVGRPCREATWGATRWRPRGGAIWGGHEGACGGHEGRGHKGAHGEATRGRPQGAKRGGHDGEAMGATQGEVCLGTTEGSGRAEASSQPGRTPCYSWSPARGTRGEQGSMRGVPDFDQVP